jgi:UDP-N-acetylmuramoylalanine--D-glutamate ligase
MTLESLALQGHANVYDNLASTVAGRIRETRKACFREWFTDFSKTEHRLEFVANIHGIEFINDSLQGNLNSAWFALESMSKPVIWIAGNKIPGAGLLSIKQVVEKKVKAIICIGAENDSMHEVFGDLEIPIADTYTMAEAVEAAYYLGRKGDVALFSPGCFGDEEVGTNESEGLAFRQAVKNL